MELIKTNMDVLLKSVGGLARLSSSDCTCVNNVMHGWPISISTCT